MKAYKLTDQNGLTKNDMQWGENVSYTATGESKKLCSDGWIHFYIDPLVFMVSFKIFLFDFLLMTPVMSHNLVSVGLNAFFWRKVFFVSSHDHTYQGNQEKS